MKTISIRPKRYISFVIDKNSANNLNNRIAVPTKWKTSELTTQPEERDRGNQKGTLFLHATIHHQGNENNGYSTLKLYDFTQSTVKLIDGMVMIESRLHENNDQILTNNTYIARLRLENESEPLPIQKELVDS